jgi:hypothetical protein
MRHPRRDGGRRQLPAQQINEMSEVGSQRRRLAGNERGVQCQRLRENLVAQPVECFVRPWRNLLSLALGHCRQMPACARGCVHVALLDHRKRPCQFLLCRCQFPRTCLRFGVGTRRCVLQFGASSTTSFECLARTQSSCPVVFEREGNPIHTERAPGLVELCLAIRQVIGPTTQFDGRQLQRRALGGGFSPCLTPVPKTSRVEQFGERSGSASVQVLDYAPVHNDGVAKVRDPPLRPRRVPFAQRSRAGALRGCITELRKLLSSPFEDLRTRVRVVRAPPRFSRGCFCLARLFQR